MPDPDMAPDRNNWVKMDNWLAAVHRMVGQQKRLTAGDLITDVIKMSGLEDSRRHEVPEPRHLVYAVASWTLQALAAEFLLKGLSLRDASRFAKTHDLPKLFKALDQSVLAEIIGQGVQQGIAIPEFLERYRKAFVECRYPFEDMTAIH